MPIKLILHFLMGTPFKNDFINQSIEIILPQNDHSDSVISFQNMKKIVRNNNSGRVDQDLKNNESF